MHNNNCRVCGYLLDSPPWGDDGSSPTFEICPCCGVEFGYEDCTAQAAKNYRQGWIEEGAEWFEAKLKPDDWNLHRQLAAIPSGFGGEHGGRS